MTSGCRPHPCASSGALCWFPSPSLWGFLDLVPLHTGLGHKLVCELTQLPGRELKTLTEAKWENSHLGNLGK